MEQEEQQTMEEYLLSQLAEPVVLKDGTVARASDGHVMTRNEAIATNILNQAMKGDLKSAQYIANLQRQQQVRNQNKKR